MFHVLGPFAMCTTVSFCFFLRVLWHLTKDYLLTYCLLTLSPVESLLHVSLWSWDQVLKSCCPLHCQHALLPYECV